MPFTAEKSSIEAGGPTMALMNHMRNTGSIMGDFDDRASSFNVGTPQYNDNF